MEYTSNVDEEVIQNAQAEKATSIASMASGAVPQQPRAVAKKSTAKRQSNTDSTTYNPSVETKTSHSIVVSNH